MHLGSASTWQCPRCGGSLPYIYAEIVQCGTCGHLEPRLPGLVLSEETIFTTPVVKLSEPTAPALVEAKFRAWGQGDPIVAGFWGDDTTPLLTFRNLSTVGMLFDDALGLFFHPDGYVAGRPTGRTVAGEELFDATGAQLVPHDAGLVRKQAVDLLALAERLIAHLEGRESTDLGDLASVRERIRRAYPRQAECV